MAINPSREEWKIRKGVFDAFTLRVLEKLRGQGHFEDIKSPVALGKEANVFTAVAEEPTIIKIYRLENRDFTRMLEYLRADPRYMHVKRRKRDIVFAWTQREYRNLLLAREAIPVPKPIAFSKNVLLMSQVGKIPAPKLKDAKLDDPDAFFSLVVERMHALKRRGLVHGDLSDFNILVDDQQPIFIDFSQASPVSSPHAQEMWERDVKNITTAANRFGVTLELGPF